MSTFGRHCEGASARIAKGTLHLVRYKSGPFRGVFWMSQNAFSRQKRIFMKPKKLTKSTVRTGDWRQVQNPTKYSQRASEASGDTSCKI